MAPNHASPAAMALAHRWKDVFFPALDKCRYYRTAMRRLLSVEVCSLGVYLLSNYSGHSQIQSQTTLESFQRKAAEFNLVLTVPRFETTPFAISDSVSNTISKANAELDCIARRAPSELTFNNTIRAIDDVYWEVELVVGRLNLLRSASTTSSLRNSATEGYKRLSNWFIESEYREDVYGAVKAFNDTRPNLNAEDARLLGGTLLGFERVGSKLPDYRREDLQKMFKKLSDLKVDFLSAFSKARDLPGWDTAVNERKRKRRFIAWANRVADANSPVVQQIVELRSEIASELGYASWADFALASQMAGNAEQVNDFLGTLETGLLPKFQSDLSYLNKLKIEETADPKAKLEIWDWQYYEQQLAKKTFQQNYKRLSEYFAYDQVLRGIFLISERLFGLRVEHVGSDGQWAPGIGLYALSSVDTGKPLGLVYFDVFPRTGKDREDSQCSLISGKRLSTGKYQCPVAVLLCNISPARGSKPALQTVHDRKVLFHEFGHALSHILGQTEYALFSGNRLPADFVEVTSELFERMSYDARIIESFAVDYRNPTMKIPATLAKQINEAEEASSAVPYYFKVAAATADLKLNSEFRKGDAAVEVWNEVLRKNAIPMPQEAAWITQHIIFVKHQAGSYGYLWSDAIVAEIVAEFSKSPAGFFDKSLGNRFRREILEKGNSRNVKDSLKAFLGHSWSAEPLIKQLRVENN